MANYSRRCIISLMIWTLATPLFSLAWAAEDISSIRYGEPALAYASGSIQRSTPQDGFVNEITGDNQTTGHHNIMGGRDVLYLRLKNPGEHRFDLPSATEPHLKFEQARVLGCEAAKHLSGGCDLLGLRSEPPLTVGATDCKRTVQLWHGPPPFCGTEPFLPNR